MTFSISGFFHGPLSERRQPPWSAHVHVPPKNSGNWLNRPTENVKNHLKGQWSIYKENHKHKMHPFYLASIISSSLLWYLFPRTCQIFQKLKQRRLQPVRQLITVIFQMTVKTHMNLSGSPRINKILHSIPQQSKAWTSINDKHLMKCLQLRDET